MLAKVEVMLTGYSWPLPKAPIRLLICFASNCHPRAKRNTRVGFGLIVAQWVFVCCCWFFNNGKGEAGRGHLVWGFFYIIHLSFWEYPTKHKPHVVFIPQISVVGYSQTSQYLKVVMELLLHKPPTDHSVGMVLKQNEMVQDWRKQLPKSRES